MRKAFIAAGVALACASAWPARALVIEASFDAAWNAPGGAPAEATAAVDAVIGEFEALFSNPVTIRIQFDWGDLNGKPRTSGAATDFTATDFPPGVSFLLPQVEGLYDAAVALQPDNAALFVADQHLPGFLFTNPNGSSDFFIPDAQYLALTGNALNADPFDAFVGFATNFCDPNPQCDYDYTGKKPAAGEIDFIAVVEHELSHAMGRVDYAFADTHPPFLMPLDFFKYDCGTTDLDPTFAKTCFSIDGGATDLFNLKFSNESDSSDWIGADADSFNAFVAKGKQLSLSRGDILVMCVLGWDAGKACDVPVPEPGSLPLFATALLCLVTWSRRRPQPGP